ncbi:hypothetical protein CBA19CS22_29240 [Caballeronia novacaledonica]|uniref:Uncharacterized protein n=1 Tax=Caballeronia novacaledonica TaxID=1544861 RepID=A0ACB5R0J7_9BURK|nr:hypothetical protein [Caballeronia sp. LZ029]MDR5747000.1 hypothetical protein [Caballeronia sp. LZ029]GJH20712.1 hypothetical protein CBA19CS22_29240 [Caballeronia novacaledonica]
MKVKFAVAFALLAVSGAASCATIAEGVAAEFATQNGALALKVMNSRTDASALVARVSLLLPQRDGEKMSAVAYQATSDVTVAPGKEAMVELLPVKQLVTTMQEHGDAPANGYSRVFVDNEPGKCGACEGLKSYGYRSVGFGAQTVVVLNGNATTATTLFGGYLVFVNQ